MGDKVLDTVRVGEKEIHAFLAHAFDVSCFLASTLQDN